MPTEIDDGLVAKKPQWSGESSGSTTPSDVLGTLATMFTVGLSGTRQGASISMEFSFDAISGAETGTLVVEKLVGSSYIRVKEWHYDSTGLTAIDGFSAGVNAIRGVSYVVAMNESMDIRVRCSQLGGVARVIVWAYNLFQGVS